MFLKSLVLKDFAGIETASIEGLDSGLNIVVGDNEVGKSTLLMALRAAFFQKHRASGEAARNLAPYGRQVRPEIGIEFSLGDVSYSLRKCFLQRAEAELSWAGGRLASDAVEEKLAELFRFSHPGRGESKLDTHQGAFGLLWVEQGRSPHGLDLGAGRDAVTASLEGEVGQILGGERGRTMLTASKARQDRFFTETGRPKLASPLKGIEDELDSLTAELAARQAARRDYDARIDRLRVVREALLAYEREGVLPQAERAFETAKEKSGGLDGLKRDLLAAEGDLRHAEARLARAAELVQSREQMAQAATQAARAAEAARAAFAGLREETGVLRNRLTDASSRAEAASEARDAAEIQCEESEAREHCARLAARLEPMRKRFAEAKAVSDRLAGLRGAAAGAEIDDEAMRAIEAAARDCREAEIRQSAAASLVRFEPDEGGTVETAAGERVEAGSAVRVLGETEFRLAGFGRIVVTAGGEAEDLARALEQARARLAALLSRRGVGSLDAARLSCDRGHQRKEAERALLADLRALAPDGLAALEEEAAALARELDALPASAEAAGLPDRDLARRNRDAARAGLTAAERALALLRSESEAMGAALVRSEADADHLAAEARRAKDRLAEAEAARATSALGEDLAAADMEKSTRAAILLTRRKAFEDADPEAIRLEALRAERALENLRRDVGALERDSVALEAEIRALGLQNLGEEIARLEGEVERLQDRRARLALEADAARLLHMALTDAQREAREHWLGPIKTRVAPYLRLIQPESEIELDDETLEIKSLHRRGVTERFERLSAGAREQVAVVTRLALADVLKRGGHPAAVILDDALVNTDEKRLKRMHLVLQKAAEGLQIIVLTCRERDFRDLGAPIFRL